MALTIKQKFVIEELFDEKGNKLGELKFNPNDSRIMAKLSKIVQDLTEALHKVDELGEIQTISDKKLETLEDFEKESNNIQKICKGLDLESSAIGTVFEDLQEIFGSETIDIFTGGTYDIEAIEPLLEFIMPYVKNARAKKVNKYLKKNDDIEVLD